jgi:hypothetical protein
MNQRPETILKTFAVALVFVAVGLTGCYSWSRQDRPLDAVLAAHEGKHVRITVQRSPSMESLCVIDNPRIEGDSLIGYVLSPETEYDIEDGRPAWMREQIKVPFHAVRDVKAYQLNGNRTTLLVAGVGLAAVYVVAAASDEDSYQPPPDTGGGTGDYFVSCPVVWSWDGAGWRIDSGTFGGAIASALRRTDTDNLEFAHPEGGTVRLRMGNIMDETEHVDAVRLLRVEHAPEVSVAPDDAGRIHTLGALTPPARAADLAGRDALVAVREPDGVQWESYPVARDTSDVAAIRDGLDLTFPRPAGARRAKLVVDGNNTVWANGLIHTLIASHGRDTERWYASLAFPSVRERTEAVMREGFLNVFVRTASGWEAQGAIREAGPEVQKRQVIELDLARVTGDSVCVRLETIPSFWLVDRVALDASPDQPCVVRELTLTEALDDAGRDLRAALASADSLEFTMETGDAATLTFADTSRAPGTAASYVLRTTGWYRVHTPETGDPDVALLRRLATEPFAASRLATARLNEALRALAAGAL